MVRSRTRTRRCVRRTPSPTQPARALSPGLNKTTIGKRLMSTHSDGDQRAETFGDPAGRDADGHGPLRNETSWRCSLPPFAVCSTTCRCHGGRPSGITRLPVDRGGNHLDTVAGGRVPAQKRERRRPERHRLSACVEPQRHQQHVWGRGLEISTLPTTTTTSQRGRHWLRTAVSSETEATKTEPERCRRGVEKHAAGGL